MLAEVAADATDLEFFFYQLHRDTRLQELVVRLPLSTMQPAPRDSLYRGALHTGMHLF